MRTHLRQPPSVKRVQARQYVGKPERHGGSLSVFIRCDDDQVYNVKFQESYPAPTGLHLLVNELVASGLGHLLGLPTPEIAVVEITPELLESDANQLLKSLYKKPVSPGLYFGSHQVQWVENNDVFAKHYLRECNNKGCFPCFFVFDIWTNNTDRTISNCLIVRPDHDPRRFYVSSVDHGYCFGGPDWTAEIENRVGQSWIGTGDDVYVRYSLDPMASEPGCYAVGAVRLLREGEFSLSYFRSLKDALEGRNPVPRPTWLDDQEGNQF